MSDDFKPKIGIPYARERVCMVISKIETKAQPSPFKDEVLSELRDAVRAMWRNVTKTPSKRISRKMDRDLVQSIMLTVIANPRASRKEVGDQFGVQSGRVTEVIQGKHDKLLSPELREVFGRHRVELEEMQLTFSKVRRAA
jgi:hypothetical protein